MNIVRKNTNFKLRLLFATVILGAVITIIGLFAIAEEQQKKIKELESRDPYSGYVFATVQVYNEETGKMDTYQGTLDFDHGLYGDWLYEYNGLECVMNGARLIGSINPASGEIEANVTAEDGKVKIYTDTDETYTFYGTVVRPLPGSEYVFYMPYAELEEFDSLWEGETENEK